MNNFQIKALPYHQFAYLFAASKEELEHIGAIKMIVDKHPGFPCRTSLQDATIGEEVILLPYQHHKTNSPYKAIGPIFIRKNAAEAALAVNEIPTILLYRLLSLRSYNEVGIMIHATVVEGKIITETLEELFTNKEIVYVHVHNAKPGCYNCVVKRA